MEHCRCNAAHINKIQAERISDTIELPPEHNKMSGISDQEASTNAALDLIEYISNPPPTSPFSSVRAVKLQAIRKLVDIFKKNTTPQKPPHNETSQMRVEIIHNNPPMKTASPRIKLPINPPTPEPAPRKNLKSNPPTPIVAYEEDKYTPPRVEKYPIHRGTLYCS